MACGCSILGNTPRDRAGICHTCIWGERDPGRGVVECRVSGLPIVRHVSEGAGCPKGKFTPDSKWAGLAYPWRVLLFILDPKHPKIGSWGACGCFMPLKSWFRNK